MSNAVIFAAVLLLLSLSYTHASQGVSTLPNLSATATNWTSCLESLEDRVDSLIARYNTFRNPINVSEIAHIIYPGNRLGMSYNDAQQMCFFRGQAICTYDEIFPNADNIPIITGVISTNSWAPIRDEYNDWTSVGPQDTGVRHMERFGIPQWGLGFFQTNFGMIKGNLYCCVPP